MPSLSAIAPNLPLVVAAVFWLAAVELAKTARWWALFGPSKPRFSVCLRALVAGQVTNQLSPLRAGEAVRLGALVAQGGPLVPGTAAMAAAKAIDTLCLAAIGAAVVGSAALGQARLALIGAGLVGLAAAALVLGKERVRSRLTGSRLARRLRLASLADVAEAMRDPGVLAIVTVTSALVWVCGIGANWAVLAAVGVPPSLDLAARVIVLGYLVGMLPAPPVRLGVYEAGVAAALTSGGVPLADAVAAGVVLHACQLAELGVLGVASLALARRPKPAS